MINKKKKKNKRGEFYGAFKGKQWLNNKINFLNFLIERVLVVYLFETK